MPLMMTEYIIARGIFFGALYVSSDMCTTASTPPKAKAGVTKPRQKLTPSLDHPPALTKVPQTVLSGAFSDATLRAIIMIKKKRTWNAPARVSQSGKSLLPYVLRRPESTAKAIMIKVACHRLASYPGLLRIATPCIIVAIRKQTAATEAIQPVMVTQP